MDAFNMTEQERRALAQRLVRPGDTVERTYVTSGLGYSATVRTAMGVVYDVRVSCVTLQIVGQTTGVSVA